MVSLEKNLYDTYIVGIGASAGGLEAIHELFDNLSAETNFSFLLIQHLSPDYKSLMTELLSRHTDMQVLEADDDMELLPNSVYVIPNKKNIILKDGRIKLVDKSINAPNTAIDVFFKSLAKEKKEKAVGVILSGTGTDGTKGIEEIKKEGGLVIVQDPVTAKFDGMPNSAIASGHVDMILPPDLIGEELIARLKSIDGFQVLSKKISEKDEEVVAAILELVRKQTQCDFGSYKRPTIVRRLAKRMAMNNIKSLMNYYDYLVTNPEEVVSVSKEFLIGVTRFFRDDEAFEIIQNKVIPELVNEKGKNELLKVWVAGCSTGEEAYSLAILLDEYLHSIEKPLEVKIFATDIDAEAIEFASKGIYPNSITEQVSPERLERHFIKNGKKYQVSPHLRKLVIFAHHDLIKDPPFGKIDLLTCRNLLIYLNQALQKKILSTFNFSLNLSGFLFLGASETVSEFSESLTDVSKKWKIYRKSGVGNRQRYDLISSEYSVDNKKVKYPVSFITKRNQHEDLTETLNDAILEEFEYAGVFVNEHYELVQAMGNFKKFLQLPDKRLNLNLLKMVPEELSVALGTSIRKAVKRQEKVSVKGVKYREKKVLRNVNIVVKPFFEDKKLLPKLILILFSEDSNQIVNVGDFEVYDESKQKDERVVELESELKELKELLQATVEEQETANEELQSANEELISANEELQSTNEELQSLNEELHTVNTEHQYRIKELIELNDDLNNYFKSTHIGQVFIDRNFIIRKFTPAVTAQINLIESDIGRSLNHISNNIHYDKLTEDLTLVMNTGATLEKEIMSANGRWYVMAIFPYVRQDKKNDGAVITFFDITNLKNLNSIITGVINSTRNCIIALKAVRDKNRIVDFEVSLANRPCESLIGLPLKDIEGKKLIGLGKFIGSEDLLKKYIQVVETGEYLHFEYFSKENSRWYEVIGVKMDDGVALTYSDISDKKDGEQKIRVAFEEIKQGRENLQKLNKELENRVEARTKELSVSEERFRLISLATNDVIKDWDLVNNNVWWNQGIEKLFGYKKSEIETGIKFWQDNIHPEDLDKVLKNLNDRINSGANQWSQEYRFRKADNTYSYVLDRGYVLHDENQIPYRMISSMLDLSEQKKSQEELKKINDNLLRINTDLDNFIYTASHDLKAPISNIEGLVYSLTDILDVEVNKEAEVILKLINDSILKFKKTIKDLTEITKLQKEISEDEGRVDVNEILEEVKFSIKDLIYSNKAIIIEDIKGSEIHFSRKNLRSILYNLLSNAIKYRSPERKPEVKVLTETSSERFIISVSDNGLGIDPSKQAKVFSMFKRFHDHVEGSGVGMYIVKRIVDNAGGSISLESELNRGTTFRIELPVFKN